MRIGHTLLIIRTILRKPSPFNNWVTLNEISHLTLLIDLKSKNKRAELTIILPYKNLFPYGHLL